MELFTGEESVRCCHVTVHVDSCNGCVTWMWRKGLERGGQFGGTARVGVMNPVHVDDCNGFFRCLTLMLPLTSMFENVQVYVLVQKSRLESLEGLEWTPGLHTEKGK